MHGPKMVACSLFGVPYTGVDQDSVYVDGTKFSLGLFTTYMHPQDLQTLPTGGWFTSAPAPILHPVV